MQSVFRIIFRHHKTKTEQKLHFFDWTCNRAAVHCIIGHEYAERSHVYRLYRSNKSNQHWANVVVWSSSLLDRWHFALVVPTKWMQINHQIVVLTNRSSMQARALLFKCHITTHTYMPNIILAKRLRTTNNKIHTTTKKKRRREIGNKLNELCTTKNKKTKSHTTNNKPKTYFLMASECMFVLCDVCARSLFRMSYSLWGNEIALKTTVKWPIGITN